MNPITVTLTSVAAGLAAAGAWFVVMAAAQAGRHFRLWAVWCIVVSLALLGLAAVPSAWTWAATPAAILILALIAGVAGYE